MPPGPLTTSDSHASEARLGAVYGVAAYVWWGLCPIYFKAVASVPALQVLAHRVIWSVLLLALLIVVQKRWSEIRRVVRDRKTLLRLCATTALIANNWGIFIWAVANDHLLQASLGYFINPLINVLLGVVFLRERLRRMQTASVLLACVGVAYMIFHYGQVPWNRADIGVLVCFLRSAAQDGACRGARRIDRGNVDPGSGGDRVSARAVSQRGRGVRGRIVADGRVVGVRRRNYDGSAFVVHRRRQTAAILDTGLYSVPGADGAIPAGGAGVWRAVYARARGHIRVHLGGADHLFGGYGDSLAPPGCCTRLSCGDQPQRAQSGS